MSNSYSISADVELAALAAAVAEIHGTDVPAIQTNVNDNETLLNALGVIITDIHDVDLAGVTTIVTQTGLILTDIHDTDLPAVVDEINDNETKIDTVITDIGVVDGVVDAIRATDITTITDAITAKKIRGQFKKAYLSTASESLVEVLNISGSGILFLIEVKTITEMGVFKVTIDGVATAEEGLALGNTKCMWLYETADTTNAFTMKFTDNVKILGLEFQDSLVIEEKVTAPGGTAQCLVYYNEN